jgi:hypothetical protein
MPAKLTIENAHSLAESRGYKFLSNEYKNANTKYLWRCGQGHEWLAIYSSIQQGKGCLNCSGKFPKTIQDAHILAGIMDYKFLSPELKNTKNKHLWGCGQGHEWMASYHDIQQGYGCPHCAGNIPKTMKDAHHLAESRGFKFLSTEFKGTQTKFLWGCGQGHEWMTRYSSIQKGDGCPHCSDRFPKTIQDAHILAGSMDYKFLSPKFYGVNYKYLWRCGQGHEWLAIYNNIQQGHGCPHCANKAPITMADAYLLADSIGYKFLSSEFKGVNKKYLWGCGQGHEWLVRYSDIKKGRGCPNCADKTRGEKLTRYCFKQMLKRNFEKIRPDWLRNPETGHKLELDGYNEQMEIAFEHQGRQHEKDCPTSYKFYNPEQLLRDEIKRQKCKERGITLIEVPEIGRRLKVKDVVPFLLSEFDKHNIAYPESAKSFQIDMREFYAEYMNEKSTTGVDDLLSELDAMDFSDDSLFVDSIMDEVNNLEFDNPDLFN